MTSFAQQPSFSARTLGPVARRLIDSGKEGRVAAVFRSAFYVGTGSRLFCVGTGDMEPGPLNLVTSAPARMDWRKTGVRLHQRAAISEREVRVACHLRIHLAGAAVWTPGPIVNAISPAAVAQGLAFFRAVYAGWAAGGGVSRFITPGFRPAQHDHECRAAAVPMAEARRWLINAFTRPELAQREDLHWVGKLTGLGTGLTPAGDDFLGGMMIALHALGNSETSRILWSGIRRCAEKTSNPISLALLRAASEGIGSASVHRAISGILLGDNAAVRASMPGIGQIGHSSGWDAITGVVTAMDCWLESQTVRVI